MERYSTSILSKQNASRILTLAQFHAPCVDADDGNGVGVLLVERHRALGGFTNPELGERPL